MKLFNSAKINSAKTLAESASSAVQAMRSFDNAMRDAVNMEEAQNYLAAISSINFVNDFNEIFKVTATRRYSVSTADLYCSSVELAIHMLLEGISENDVLEHFKRSNGIRDKLEDCT